MSEILSRQQLGIKPVIRRFLINTPHLSGDGQRFILNGAFCDAFYLLANAGTIMRRVHEGLDNPTELEKTLSNITSEQPKTRELTIVAIKHLQNKDGRHSVHIYPEPDSLAAIYEEAKTYAEPLESSPHKIQRIGIGLFNTVDVATEFINHVEAGMVSRPDGSVWTFGEIQRDYKS